MTLVRYVESFMKVDTEEVRTLNDNSKALH